LRVRPQKRISRLAKKPEQGPLLKAHSSKPAIVSVDKLSPDDAVLREFVADLYAAFSHMRMLRNRIAQIVGLSSAEHSVLLGVWYLQRSGPPTVRAVAEHLHVAAAHATAEIGKLVEAGLLTKTPDPQDRRAVAVQLSKAGEEVFERLSPILREINDHLFAGIYYGDMVIVHRFFERIIAQAPAAVHVAEGYIRRTNKPELGAPSKRRVSKRGHGANFAQPHD
jgi:MarR family transcriptional regulator, organic hydroperoxide resistance regulator